MCVGGPTTGGGKQEIEARKQSTKGKISTLRTRLQMSSQWGFIVDSAQPPEEAELRKDKFAPKFLEIENPAIEAILANEIPREGHRLSEMGDGAHVERGSISNEEHLQKKEE